MHYSSLPTQRYSSTPLSHPQLIFSIMCVISTHCGTRLSVQSRHIVDDCPSYFVFHHCHYQALLTRSRCTGLWVKCLSSLCSDKGCNISYEDSKSPPLAITNTRVYLSIHTGTLRKHICMHTHTHTQRTHTHTLTLSMVSWRQCSIR